MRKFVDIDHPIQYDYDEIIEMRDIVSNTAVVFELKALIEEDPFYFDPYLTLAGILESEGNLLEALHLRELAYELALDTILDEDNKWPDTLDWVFIENRHIIRALFNMVDIYWQNNQAQKALYLLRNLLRVNPLDNIEARYNILAIRMGLSFQEFQKLTDRNENGGFDIGEWFESNKNQFPEDFDWWKGDVEDILK
jgi:tetratricopeptide (TPR) repeat protein